MTIFTNAILVSNTQSGQVERCNVDSKSYGGDDRPFRQGFVKINGIQVTPKDESRGFTLVRLNDDCSVMEMKTYDTHLYIQESRNMTDYLENLPINTRIAGITYDEYNHRLSNSTKSELRNIGLNMTSASWRSTLCFVFTIGKPQYTKQS